MRSLSATGQPLKGRQSMLSMDGRRGENTTMTVLRSPPLNMSRHASLDDYSRVMLQYTQRQMAAFTDIDHRNRHNSVGSSSSGSSNTSGRSNTSIAGEMARGAIGPNPPTAPEVSGRMSEKRPRDVNAHF